MIVVLSEREKEAMEEDLHKSSDGDNAGTIVVCRSGSPLLLSDLNKVIRMFPADVDIVNHAIRRRSFRHSLGVRSVFCERVFTGCTDLKVQLVK